MSEDLETIIKEVYSCYGARYGNAIVNLKQENEQLKERIKNALEFLEIIQYNETYGKKYIDYNELIEILEGEEKTQEEYKVSKDPSGHLHINGETYKIERIS